MIIFILFKIKNILWLICKLKLGFSIRSLPSNYKNVISNNIISTKY